LLRLADADAAVVRFIRNNHTSGGWSQKPKASHDRRGLVGRKHPGGGGGIVAHGTSGCRPSTPGTGFRWRDKQAATLSCAESTHGTQPVVLALEPAAGEVRRVRFRLTPDHVAGMAAKVHCHQRTNNGLDLCAVANPAHRIRRPICSAPVIDRESVLEHVAEQVASCAYENANAIGRIP
jgi:hypothetical protein